MYFLKKNIPLLIRINAAGHSFAVSILSNSDKDSQERISICNSLLVSLFKKKTNIVLTEINDQSLSQNGYVVLSSLQRISDINIGSFN